jgi:L-fuconolactonase
MLDNRYGPHPKFRGMRHLIHEEQDPDWVVWDLVLEGLKLFEERNLLFEIVAVYPNHLKHVPTLAEALPELTLIIDHLAKPPIADGVMGEWADQLAAAAEYPNVYAKVSGLNTAADWDTWSAQDLKPYIDFGLEKFGSQRLMFGSDWPVCVLAGNYKRVWEETLKALSTYSQEDQDAILGETAMSVYRPGD